ncbi:hypothetical protein CW751_03085 [Brumimicrobium salinarum]|uniref:Uncharacterized protein n=1 Tax=Brumimicrobium salinarum TaxID=2058658 RepID=A0A2I0R4L9_9FLAO|nr:biotin/lipoyl-binding protein [Brumimicrobium salinarum]PKR81525.1 hypothetical protein CW751_03085 [Brumimicrobium salinarum]
MTILNKILRFTLSFAVVTLVFTSCSEKKEVASEIPQKKTYCLEESFKANIKTEHTKRQLMVNEFALSGSVETNPDKVIHFSNLVDGIIVNTNFSLGDYVKKGQVLAKVKSTELTEWKAQQKILASKLTVAQHDFNSVEKYNYTIIKLPVMGQTYNTHKR